jgi:hypothetical protein
MKEDFIYLKSNTEIGISGEMTLQCVYGSCKVYSFISLSLGLVHGHVFNTKSRVISIHSDSLILETFKMKNKEVVKKYEKKLNSLQEFECVLMVKFKKLETHPKAFLSEEFKLEMNKIKKNQQDIQVSLFIYASNLFYSTYLCKCVSLISLVNHLLNERIQVHWMNFELENGLITHSLLKKPIFSKSIPMEKSQFIGDCIETQLDLYMDTIHDFMKQKSEFNVIHLPILSDPWIKEQVWKWLNPILPEYSFESFSQRKSRNMGITLWDGDSIVLPWNEVLVSFNHLDSHLVYQCLYLLNNALVQLGNVSNFNNPSSTLPLFSLNYVSKVDHFGFGKIMRIDVEKKQFHLQTNFIQGNKKVNVIQFYKKETYPTLNSSLVNKERGMNGYMIKKRSMLRGVQKY